MSQILTHGLKGDGNSLINMFDFLNQLSHNHTVDSQLSVEPINQERSNGYSYNEGLPPKRSQNAVNNYDTINPLSNQDNNNKLKPKKPAQRSVEGSSIVGKMQQIQKISFPPKVHQIFSGMLTESQNKLSELLLKNIKKIKNKKQQIVFVRQTSSNNQQYLSEVSNSIQNQNYILKQGLSNTIEAITNQICFQIQQNQIKSSINKKKQEEDDKKMEALKLIRLRESELHQKIGELNIQLGQDVDLVDRRAHQIIDQDDFNPNSAKTKCAEEFVKGKQRQREDKKAELQEIKERKRKVEMQLREEQQREAQRVKKQKHERLVEQFIDKQQQKRKRQEQARTEQIRFQQFLHQYHQEKPLYKQKEEDFQQQLKQQRIQRYHILKQKQAKYEPLNIENLQIHQQKYEELRKEDRERKSAEMQLKRQEDIMRKKELDQKVYKGRFRYLILNQMVEAQARQREKQAQKQAILIKKQAYSLEVKQRYKPRIDLAKKLQIQQLINSSSNKKRKYQTPNRVAYSEHYSTISSAVHPSYPALSEADACADPKRQGQKYHRLFKQYIRDKIQKGEIKDNPKEHSVETLQPRPNYLQELRQKYQGKIPSESSRLDRQIEILKQKEDYGAVLLKAEQFQNRLRQREVKLRNSVHSPNEQARLEQQYLCAIKAKLSLINSID